MSGRCSWEAGRLYECDGNVSIWCPGYGYFTLAVVSPARCTLYDMSNLRCAANYGPHCQGLFNLWLDDVGTEQGGMDLKIHTDNSSIPFVVDRNLCKREGFDP